MQERRNFRVRLFTALAVGILSLHSAAVSAQSKVDSLLGKLDPQKLSSAIIDRAKKMEEKLVKKSIKTLEQLQQQEEKIFSRMLSGKDSLQAKANLAELKEKYGALKDKLKHPQLTQGTTYLPKLDSLTTSLKFLSQSGISGKLSEALSKTQSLQDKFAQAEAIKNFIKHRREQLKQQLEKLGLVKQLKQINKKVYYYAAQLKEYKAILNDPKKIEKKALELLSKTKLFQEFFKKNSMLASLFRLPGDVADPAYTASLSGLQTRAQVNTLIQQQIQRAGPAGMQQFRDNMNAAQSQLTQLKDKVMKHLPAGASGNSDDIMPEGFKPNEEHTKSFLQRLELGTTVQTQKATSFFPTTSDVAMSVGYKLNDKSIIGVGASYKMGLGRGWNAIKFTSEGVGLRSYVDWKVKGSLWISGGYEMNYRSAFQRFTQLKSLNAWQQSGLLGLSKSIPVKSKFFKKTKLQLLWDFLSQQQVPRTQPILFRVGYNF